MNSLISFFLMMGLSLFMVGCEVGDSATGGFNKANNTGTTEITNDVDKEVDADITQLPDEAIVDDNSDAQGIILDIDDDLDLDAYYQPKKESSFLVKLGNFLLPQAHAKEAKLRRKYDKNNYDVFCVTDSEEIAEDFDVAEADVEGSKFPKIILKDINLDDTDCNAILVNYTRQNGKIIQKLVVLNDDNKEKIKNPNKVKKEDVKKVDFASDLEAVSIIDIVKTPKFNPNKHESISSMGPTSIITDKPIKFESPEEEQMYNEYWEEQQELKKINLALIDEYVIDNQKEYKKYTYQLQQGYLPMERVKPSLSKEGQLKCESLMEEEFNNRNEILEEALSIKTSPMSSAADSSKDLTNSGVVMTQLNTTSDLAAAKTNISAQPNAPIGSAPLYETRITEMKSSIPQVCYDAGITPSQSIILDDFDYANVQGLGDPIKQDDGSKGDALADDGKGEESDKPSAAVLSQLASDVMDVQNNCPSDSPSQMILSNLAMDLWNYYKQSQIDDAYVVLNTASTACKDMGDGKDDGKGDGKDDGNANYATEYAKAKGYNSICEKNGESYNTMLLALDAKKDLAGIMGFNSDFENGFICVAKK